MIQIRSGVLLLIVLDPNATKSLEKMTKGQNLGDPLKHHLDTHFYLVKAIKTDHITASALGLMASASKSTSSRSRTLRIASS